MIVNTQYDTWENLNRYFPGRAERHYRIYPALLSALIMVRQGRRGADRKGVDARAINRRFNDL